MEITLEQLQEVAAYISQPDVQALLQTLLVDLEYNPAEDGNPLIFALSELGASYADMKAKIQVNAFVSEKEAEIAALNQLVENVKLTGEIPE